MIRIYTSPNCSSCKKVKQWFMDNNIPFIEKSIFSPNLKEKDLRDILSKSDNGTDDIISKRSKIILTSGVDINSMTVNELISFIMKNPTVLKRPIIVDDRKILVGYNPDDIRVFIPQAQRIAAWACTEIGCPKYVNCEHAQDSAE